MKTTKTNKRRRRALNIFRLKMVVTAILCMASAIAAIQCYSVSSGFTILFIVYFIISMYFLFTIEKPGI